MPRKCAYCGQDVGENPFVCRKSFCSARHWGRYMDSGPMVAVKAFGGAKTKLCRPTMCSCGCGTRFVKGEGVSVGRRWFVDKEHSRQFNRDRYQRKKEAALKDRRPKLEPP